MRPKSYHPEFDMPVISESGGVRYLHFGTELEQGAMQLSEPHRLLYKYTRQMCAFLLFMDLQSIHRVALLGLGNGSLMRFLRHHFDPAFTLVEWNPAVTQCCMQHFALVLKERDQLYHADAEVWVQNSDHAGSCDVLLIDLYDHSAEGPVCTSEQFYLGCREVLREGGAAVCNLFGYHESFDESMRHIRKVFGDSVFVLEENQDGNQVVLAFKNGPSLNLTVDSWRCRAEYLQDRLNLEMLEIYQELFTQLSRHKTG